MRKRVKDWLASIFGRTKTSTSRIIYRLPDPNQYTKLYNISTAFQKNTKGCPGMDWSNWDAVVDGFRSRIIDWYFKPFSDVPDLGDDPRNLMGYPLLCTMCALIDLLTQYEFNEPWQDMDKYKKFLRRNIPEFDKNLRRPFPVSVRRGGRWQLRRLYNYADVFYHGIRSSLHHHGDLAPYAGMRSDSSGKGVMVHEIQDAGESECGKYKYSILIVDPRKLRNRLEVVFNNYCDELKSDPSSEKARFFRERFREDFGIIIS